MNRIAVKGDFRIQSNRMKELREMKVLIKRLKVEVADIKKIRFWIGIIIFVRNLLIEIKGNIHINFPDSIVFVHFTDFFLNIGKRVIGNEKELRVLTKIFNITGSRFF